MTNATGWMSSGSHQQRRMPTVRRGGQILEYVDPEGRAVYERH
jgi:hypothetical protein